MQSDCRRRIALQFQCGCIDAHSRRETCPEKWSGTRLGGCPIRWAKRYERLQRLPGLGGLDFWCSAFGAGPTILFWDMHTAFEYPQFASKYCRSMQRIRNVDAYICCRCGDEVTMSFRLAPRYHYCRDRGDCQPLSTKKGLRRGPEGAKTTVERRRRRSVQRTAQVREMSSVILDPRDGQGMGNAEKDDTRGSHERAGNTSARPRTGSVMITQYFIYRYR